MRLPTSSIVIERTTELLISRINGFVKKEDFRQKKSNQMDSAVKERTGRDRNAAGQNECLKIRGPN